jgi:hypothetical protein
MEKDATYALGAGIYVWIQDNSSLVALAQTLAKKCVDLGLCDTNMHNPFQIVPTDIFAENGNLHHELFVNIDHPAWGYFKLTITSDCEFHLLSPKLSYLPDKIFLNISEVKDYIDDLAKSLDEIYELEDLLFSKKIDEANKLLDYMLKYYIDKTFRAYESIKLFVNSFPGKLYISATNDESAKEYVDGTKDYDLALLHPENWHVEMFEGLSNIEDAQDDLRKVMYSYLKKENHYSSMLYLAQKLIKESGFKVYVDGEEVLYDDKMKLTLVRPVLNAKEIKIDG